MSIESDKAQEDAMLLPPGKTCADCRHVRRCTAFGFTDSPSNTACDFGPSRFQLAAPQQTGEQKGEGTG